MNKCNKFIFNILTNFFLIANDVSMSFIFRSTEYELKKNFQLLQLLFTICIFLFKLQKCLIYNNSAITMQAGFDTSRLKGYKI